MKIFLFLLFFLISSVGSFAQMEKSEKSIKTDSLIFFRTNPEHATYLNPDTTEVYVGPEIMPKFRNGPEDWKKYIAEDINTPDSAKAAVTAVIVIVQFVVERNGDLSHIKVLNHFKEIYAQEAMKLVKESGKWHSGIEKGVVVRTLYTVVIGFGQDEK